MKFPRIVEICDSFEDDGTCYCRVICHIDAEYQLLKSLADEKNMGLRELPLDKITYAVGFLAQL